MSFRIAMATAAGCAALMGCGKSGGTKLDAEKSMADRKVAEDKAGAEKKVVDRAASEKKAAADKLAEEALSDVDARLKVVEDPQLPIRFGPGIIITVTPEHFRLELPNPGMTLEKLTFPAACKLGLVRKDCTLLAEKSGIVARDAAGKEWTSRKAKWDGKEVFPFFPAM
jgi:hypothetical protein